MQVELARAIPMPAQTIIGAAEIARFLECWRTLKNEHGKFGATPPALSICMLICKLIRCFFASLKDKLHV